MSGKSRRQLLRIGSSIGTVGFAGCVSGFGAGSSPESPENDTQSCDKHIYCAPESDSNGALPWHLYIRNISLSTYPLSIAITDLSGGTPKEVVSFTARSDAETELVFDLSPNTRYRIHCTLHRPEKPEEAATKVSGWNRVTGTNEALRVAVDNGEFGIRRVHYDPGMEPTDGGG